MNRKLVINGVSGWQLGYFVSELNKMMSTRNYVIDNVDESNNMTIEFKKLSTIGEFRLLGLVRRMAVNYVFKG